MSEAAGFPTRRRLVTGGLAGIAGLGLGGSLGGCGLRLDLPQPPPPTPTRRRVPDEAVLLDAAVLLALPLTVARGLGAASPAQAAAIKNARELVTAQRTVVVGRLTNAGVPVAEIPTVPTPTSNPTMATFVEALWHVPATSWDLTASAGAGTRDLLWAASTARRRAALGLGERDAFSAVTASLRSAWAPLVAPLGYAFEVVAAQSAGEVRERALASLRDVRSFATQLGSPTGDPFALPFAVTDAASARRLASQTLARVVSGALVASRALSPADLDGSAALSATIQRMALGWGAAPATFPGLTT